VTPQEVKLYLQEAEEVLEVAIYVKLKIVQLWVTEVQTQEVEVWLQVLEGETKFLCAVTLMTSTT